MKRIGMIFPRVFMMLVMLVVWDADALAGPVPNWTSFWLASGILTAMTVIDSAIWLLAPKAARGVLTVVQVVKELSLSAVMLMVLGGASTPATFVLGVVASGMWMLLVMVELVVWSRTGPVEPVTI